MIIVEIDKNDLLNMICGCNAKNNTQANELVRAGFMNYCGGFVDEFSWNKNSLSRLDEEQLYFLYQILTKDIEGEIKKLGVTIKVNIK